MKKGAIFDMDGTLFDTERLYAKSWTMTAEQFGQVPNPDFPYVVAGTDRKGQLNIIQQYYPDVDAQAFWGHCSSRMEKILKSRLPEKPGVHEILTAFQKCGVKMAVASSNEHSKIAENLHRGGIASFFDAIASGEDVKHGKPAPDIFLLAAGMLGCTPEECYVFEDSIHGARAGIAAGCATIMIPDMFPPTKDLRTNCVGIYSSLWEAKCRILDDVAELAFG